MTPEPIPGVHGSRSTPTKPSAKPLEEGDDGANAYSIVDCPIGCSVYLRQRDANEPDSVIGVAHSFVHGAVRSPDRLDREPCGLDDASRITLRGDRMDVGPRDIAFKKTERRRRKQLSVGDL